MLQQKAGCIVTLGGDGTNRAVAKGAGSVPILPISTGTNNVFPAMIEGTLAGLAAGLIAGNLVSLTNGTYRSTRLEVLLDGKVADTALVDAAVYDDFFIGSRAVWDMQKVRQIFLNRAEPFSIGISSIGGVIHPVSAEAPEGLYLELGRAARSVICPVAPGIIQKVCIKKKTIMQPRKEARIAFAPSVLALDGEREIEIEPHQKASVRLELEGPVVVDVKRTMTAAVKKKVFSDRKLLEKIGYG
jgi:predicted polyphosphate/ATP-dependent NAD kinase